MREAVIRASGRSEDRPRRNSGSTRHFRRWRSTNLLERSLGEVKRRTKVIGRFPDETSCLTLVWAVLDLYIGHHPDPDQPRLLAKESTAVNSSASAVSWRRRNSAIVEWSGTRLAQTTR